MSNETKKAKPAIVRREYELILPEYGFLRHQVLLSEVVNLDLPEVPGVFGGFRGLVTTWRLVGWGKTPHEADAMVAVALKTV